MDTEKWVNKTLYLQHLLPLTCFVSHIDKRTEELYRSWKTDEGGLSCTQSLAAHANALLTTY